MGLLGKLSSGFGMIKNGIGQGIQGAKNFAGKAWDVTKQGISKAGHFVYDNREHIGNALQAASPFIGAINPVLGLAASTGGSFLSNLNPGPVKDKLKEVSQSYNNENVGVRGSTTQQPTTQHSSAQQSLEERKKNSKKGKIMTQL